MDLPQSDLMLDNNINYQRNENLQFPEIGSPSVGPYISPTFNQNLSYNDQIYGTMVCYNCLSVLLIRHDWNYARCGECQKINKIPHRNNSTNSNNFYGESENISDLIGDVPYVFGIVNCPFCTTENKIRKDSKRITCYNCSNSFNVNGYSNSKNNVVREKVTKVIHTGEYIPVYQNNNNNHCNCSNTVQLMMLDKILNEIKEKKKPLIAYPTIFADPFGFQYRNLIQNNYRYKDYNENRRIIKPLSISQPKLKKDSDSNGFRITIKKKNKNENGNISLNKSESTVFEKIFFTNKLNNSVNKSKESSY